MDSVKIGALIAKLRKEKGLTQKNIADAIGISPKTVSKWECGMGCADLPYWPALSELLEVDMAQILEGEITINKPDSGNIHKIRFYVCPSCGNILTSTGSASIFCCGRKLEPLVLQDETHRPEIHVQGMDAEYYVELDHPMTKTHYLPFVAYVTGDMVLLRRLYPEQMAAIRLPVLMGGKFYAYCNKRGLFAYPKLI